MLLFISCDEDDKSKNLFRNVIATNGIEYFDNLLWVTDLVGQSITAFDPLTGKMQIQHNFNKISTSPDDLAFLDDGTIFWTAPTQGSVGKIDPDGSIEIFGRVGEIVNPIARRPSTEEIYIGFEKNNKHISTIDRVGNEVIKVTGLPSINGFSFAEDGFLYAPLFDLEDLNAPGGVIKVDVDNNSFENLEATFPEEPNKTGFVSTVATVADLKGSLYVLEALPPKIYKVNLTTNKAVKLASLPSFTADHITIGEDDKLYMTTFASNIVFEVDQDGNKRGIVIKR